MEDDSTNLHRLIDDALNKLSDHVLNEIYPRQFKRKMISELRIEPEHITEFFARLEGLADLFEEFERTNAETPKPRQVQNGWMGVLGRLDKLKSAFDELGVLTGEPNPLALAFSQLEKYEVDNPVYVNEPQSFEEDNEYNRLVDSYLTRSETLFLELDSLRDLVVDHIEGLPRPKQGQSINMALRTWIVSLFFIWRDILGRKFTRDVAQNGEPISEAAIFVSLAAQPLKLDETKCLNMMRRVISEGIT